MAKDVIIDYLTGEAIKATPEEYNRQEIIKIIHEDYGYPKDCIIKEYRVKKAPSDTSLLGLLKQGGIIYIGDVAFQTRDGLESCRLDAGEYWDDEEIYFVYEELKEYLPNLKFEEYSFCSGLLTIKN